MAALPLPPGLRLRLREGIPQDTARELLWEPPQLPAQPLPPFTFAPRRLRLGPQHPLLEDGDVHRHLYLQGVLTSLEEVSERPNVPKHTSCPAEQGPSVPMEVSVETAEQFQLDPVETGPGEDMEIPQPAASPGPSLPEKRLYRSRIPSTICFGQGATRGFKGPRKKV
ncbi:PREDICTED: zinc finger protein 511 [Lepidothrix coronata]|uniref:Zinc finger protein 511 n=1 Tax=Lepidothrix coronata TaxID=321398 RepID=A0A6J0INA7_9PASS|nr:PREDICTED: zinc finger protein 511 [Lepidothrix coronata]